MTDYFASGLRGIWLSSEGHGFLTEGRA